MALYYFAYNKLLKFKKGKFQTSTHLSEKLVNINIQNLFFASHNKIAKIAIAISIFIKEIAIVALRSPIF